MDDESPQTTNQNDNDPNQQDEDEDESLYCPVFTNSAPFHFMTTTAYHKREDTPETGGGTSLEESEKLFRHVRPMKALLGLLENPHGSVKLWQGSTGVIAAVYGPSDVRMSKELPHRAAVDVLFRPKVTGSGNLAAMLAAGMMDPILEERAIEQTISGILESVVHLEDHVQAGFNIILHEYENDGCLLSTCINATCLALLNAGCSLRSIFAAVTIGVCGDKLIIDPCSKQIQELKTLSKSTDTPASFLTFTLTNSQSKGSFSPEVLQVSVQGRVSVKTLKTCYSLVSGNSKVYSEVFGFVTRVLAGDLAGMRSDAIRVKDEVEMKVYYEDVKDEPDDDDDYEEEEEEGEVIDSDEDM